MVCPHCKKEIEPVEERISNITVITDMDGRVKIWAEEIRDIDGILLSKRVDAYEYFKESGDIDNITLKVYDGEGSLLSEKIIEHSNTEDRTKNLVLR